MAMILYILIGVSYSMKNKLTSREGDAMKCSKLSVSRTQIFNSDMYDYSISDAEWVWTPKPWIDYNICNITRSIKIDSTDPKIIVDLSLLTLLIFL